MGVGGWGFQDFEKGIWSVLSNLTNAMISSRFRCHVTIHFGQCPEKAMACSVSGCKQIFRRKLWEEHMRRCALSHAVETEGEMQKLKRMIYTQVIIRFLTQ